MALPVDGDYYIVNNYTSAGVLYLTVADFALSDNSNVKVNTLLGNDRQVWQLRTMKDGTRRITSRYTGKSVYINTTASSPQDVRMWTENSNKVQKLYLKDLGSYMSIGDTSYSLYNVTFGSSASNAMCMELSGSGSQISSGQNVTSVHYGGAADQKWAFVPIPEVTSGGVYELVLRLDKNFALDVSSGSKTNNANVILTGRHNANDHKFYLEEYATNKWRLRNIASGNYVQVYNGTAAAGTNVTSCAWNANNANRYLWRLDSYGNITCNGKTCQYVKMWSWVDGAAQTYVMDANQNQDLDLGNICIVTTDGTDRAQQSQQWVLYPTMATDPNMSIPTDLGWVKHVGDAPSHTSLPSQETLYPSWVCTDAWATSGPNHYEWRYRKRTLDATRSSWGDWTDYTAWETAICTISGTRAWVTDGLPATYTSEFKGIQYEYEVRTVGVNETQAVVGQSVSAIVSAQAEPTTVLSNAGFGPAGLRMDYTSDYASGANLLRITSIKRDGVELLTNAGAWGLQFGTLWTPTFDNSTSIGIPVDNLKDWIDDGDELVITWYNGTDQILDFGNPHTGTLTVSYDTGSGAAFTPEVSMADGRVLSIDLNTALPVQNVYMRAAGEIVAATKKADGTFSIVYPFGQELELFAVAVSTDGDTWGVWHQSYSDGNLFGYRPCHAWNWDGGSFLLEMDVDKLLTTDEKWSAVHDAVTLNHREFQAVLMSGSFEGQKTARGVIHNYDDSARKAIHALRKAGHVTYRSPRGGIYDVAVTDIAVEATKLYAEVTVNMILETR